MRRAFVYCFVLLFALATATAFGQAVDSQQISGTVTNSSDAVVSDASVTVANTGTGLTRAAKTNTDGNYIVLDLPIGSYTVTIVVSGFKTAIIHDIHVEVGGKLSVPIVLQVGAETESITVEANGIQVHTTSALQRMIFPESLETTASN